MHIPILWFMGGIALIYCAMVIYAVYRGRDVRACFKLPFAAFLFEAKEPDAARDVEVRKERLP